MLRQRNSGIELLKIISIFLIVIYHVVQTLGYDNPYIKYNEYIIDLSRASSDIRKMILIVLGYFGAWGNTIFFVCSAWFLTKSSVFSKKMVLYVF